MREINKKRENNFKTIINIFCLLKRHYFGKKTILIK